MKSIKKHTKKMYKDQKGVLGMDTAKSFMLAILTLGVIAFAIVIALNSLNNSNAGTNDTTLILNNISDGVTGFFANAGTWFSLLAVVIIILVIAVVIFAVNRFGNDRGVTGGL